MDEIISLLGKGWTPGAVGIYAFGFPIVAMLAVGLWKGLPALLDAWTRRADAEAKRNETEFARLHQLHMDCEKRVSDLTEAYDKRIAALFEQVDSLRCQLAGAMEKIAGLVAAKAQQQVSTAHILSNALPDKEALRLNELAAQASKALEKK